MSKRWLLTLALAVLYALPMSLPAENERDPKAAARFLEEGVASFEVGDLEVAIVHLKNALQQDSSLVSAHLLLSRVYLKQGKGGLAQSSARQAERNGADRVTVVPLLAQAYLQQFKYTALLEKLDPAALPPRERVELLLFRAQAYLETSDIQRAAQTFEEAQRLAPDQGQPLIGLATVALRRNKFSAAQAAIDSALAIDPGSAEAWNVQASIRHAQGDLEGALAAYGEALARDPLHREVRVARVGLLLDLNRDEETRADLLYLADKYPSDPRAAYLRALKVARAGDVQGARSHLAQAAVELDSYRAKLVNNNAQLLNLGGLVHYGLGQFDSAAEYLERLVQIKPHDVGARKLLASVYLRTRNYDKALTLLSAAGPQPHDAQFLSLLAGAWMGQGQHQKAAALLEQALALPQVSRDLETQLAAARVQTGDAAGAMSLLDKIVTTQPDSGAANLLLAVLHYRRSDFVQAERLLREHLEREPDNLTVLNILGAAQAGQGDAAAARATFDDILRRDPQFVPAHVNRANLAVAAGDLDQARRELAEFLKQKPYDQQVLMALARVEMRAGDERAAVTWLEQGRTAERTAIPIRIALADLLTRLQEFDRAEKTLLEAQGTDPDDLGVMQALARLALVRGQNEDARVVLTRMADRAAFDSRWLVQIATLQHEAGAIDAARHSLRKALQAEPATRAARIGLADIALEIGDAEAAKTEIAAIVERWPDLPITSELQGHLAMLERRFSDAVAHYARALPERTGAAAIETAIKLAAAHYGAGQVGAAFDVLEAQIARMPAAPDLRYALAEMHMRVGDLDAAGEIYSKLSEDNAEDANALNNLAYIAALQNKTEALALAERAYALAPDDADVADTLGWVLTEAGRPEEALGYLREAQARNGTSPGIRYHLALALEALGRREEARREIAAALEFNTLFPGRDDAEKMRTRLK